MHCEITITNKALTIRIMASRPASTGNTNINVEWDGENKIDYRTQLNDLQEDILNAYDWALAYCSKSEITPPNKNWKVTLS